jgi:hypothetical protein
MSTVPQQVATSLPFKPLEVFVRGRIEGVRHHERQVYTVVVCPAHDEYTAPPRIEIRSEREIGSPGTIITQRCELGGFIGRAFDVTDKRSGEIRRARFITHTVDAIEEPVVR